ncbi:glycosyltransferase family 39 protein [Geobacter sp. AOG1]|uniref:glycosyltransferase family 39 protein n=1 Tax=Geobacter sp. AOG1 TaxID=1566346 RepID=UPI001CC7AB24|nr:glycosyltransferase family 39 protein [Geobacter sp. AOG1]GFE58467.1 membrane protein [Geobacter sp. AOG1]
MLWLNNNSRIQRLLCPVLLVAVSLAIYYPALSSGIHPVDDSGIIDFYSSSPSLIQILLPTNNSYYYRPVIELSFYLDNLLWNMNSQAMHLENILLHCANCLLVYLLILKIAGKDTGLNSWSTFLATLWFALLPVNVEPVVWIAGRTDLLLALCILSAFYFWLCWLESPSWQNFAVTVILFCSALLTKETALAFCGVAMVFAFTWPGSATLRQRLTSIAAVVVPCLLLFIVVLALKKNASGFSRLMAVTDLNFVGASKDLLAALGFYLTKLIIPVPLNFAITEVHPAYFWGGALFAPALWWLYARKRVAATLFISATIMLIPPLALAIRHIAWTPVAERYLYLPAAFCAIGLACILARGVKKYGNRVIILLLLILCGYAVVSVQRTLLWNDKEAFYQDAIAKSPGFGSLYNDLGGVFLRKHEFEKASEAFAMADRLNKRESMRLLIKANMMLVLLAQENYEGVRETFFHLFKDKREASADALEILYRADSRRMNQLSGKDKSFMATDLLETLDVLYNKRCDPFWLYRSGQMAVIVGDESRAATYFRRAYSDAPLGAHYKQAAKTYLQRLESAQ